MAALHFGDPISHRIPLEGEQHVLGRATSDACLDHPTVSHYHARVFRLKARWYLEDLCSENGTFLRLPAAVSHRLWHGARLLVGRTVLGFREGLRQSWSYQPATVKRLASALARHPAYFLEILEGGEEGDLRHLALTTTWLGRTASTIPVAGDPSMSRNHLRVDAVADGFWVSDWGFGGEGSLSGTWLEVGGVVELLHGDRLRLGAVEALVE